MQWRARESSDAVRPAMLRPVRLQRVDAKELEGRQTQQSRQRMALEWPGR